MTKQKRQLVAHIRRSRKGPRNIRKVRKIHHHQKIRQEPEVEVCRGQTPNQEHVGQALEGHLSRNRKNPLEVAVQAAAAVEAELLVERAHRDLHLRKGAVDLVNV